MRTDRSLSLLYPASPRISGALHTRSTERGRALVCGVARSEALGHGTASCSRTVYTRVHVFAMRMAMRSCNKCVEKSLFATVVVILAPG